MVNGKSKICEEGMIMKKYLFIFGMIIFSSIITYSYDNKSAHREFNRYILKKFLEDYKNWTEFKNYSFLLNFTNLKGEAITKSGWWSPTTTTENFTADKWITEGGYSADEPEVPAAYRHFYDPLANDGKTFLTDLNKALALFNPQIDAIEWHFIGNDPTNANDWTWILGKDYMVKAMQSSVESERNEYLAKAFRCLGEVLHNTADMGCPPHVRNDAHGGMGLGGPDPYESTFNPGLISTHYKDQIAQSYKTAFEDAKTAMDINMELAKFTNIYFFSDETISGNGVESYSSRNGKKDYPSPKLEKLIYEADNFNYFSTMPSGRKIEMCNDQSLLLGYLTQDFRAYPRVTKKNASSQATELIPMIVNAGSQVMRKFFPIFKIEISINSKEKKITGSVKHIATNEYPSSISYNGKVGFKIDGVISSYYTSCSNGNFELNEIDTKIPSKSKVQAFINFADIMIVSDEIVNEIVDPPSISGVQNLTDKWQRWGMGFTGDTIKIAGKFPGVNANNLKVKFINFNGLVEANVISIGTTEIRAIVPFAKSNDEIHPSLVKMFVEINSVKSEEVYFNIQNWWFPEFCKFKIFSSEISGKFNFDNGSSYNQNIFEIESTKPLMHWPITNLKCNGTSFSFDVNYTDPNGRKFVAKINGSISSQTSGKQVTVNFDIETSKVIEDNYNRKVEVKTYKQFSIENLNYHGIWSTEVGDSSYNENPNYEENGQDNPELINKIKITKLEIETIETDKKASPPTQKVTKTGFTKLDKITFFQIQFGAFVD